VTDPVTSALSNAGPNTNIINGADPSAQQTVNAENVINIDPTSPPPMRTLVYSPDVRIYIARGNKQYDVSNDVVAWSIRRVENGVSSAVFRLSNKAASNDPKKLRYNQLFERMDRVIIWLKRVEWVQVFSGYLDSVPHVQLYPGTVSFRASCTLKRLMNTWWDPALPASQEIFSQITAAQVEQQNGESIVDAGLGSLLRRLLVLVGKWDPKNIHIQRFPVRFFEIMEQQLRQMTPGDNANIEEFKKLILGEGDTSLGVGKAAGMQQGVTMGGYALTQPERMLEVIKAVDEMGMGPNSAQIAAAQGVAGSALGGKDQRDQQAWESLQQVGKNWTDAALKDDAAVHCFMTIAAESNWHMYANRAVPESFNYNPDPGFISPDGTSVGLYQQQNFGEWGDVRQRMNVKASTQMFLQALNRLEWRNMDRAAACQAVQRSAYSDGSNYKKHEQIAIEQVRAIRSGSGTGAGAGAQDNGNPIPGFNAGATPVGSVSTPALPGTTSSPIPSIPTVNGTPGAMSASIAAGRPAYDTAGALSCARAQIGKPYVWGGEGPNGFDCSGLMLFAYASIGLNIVHNTNAQLASLQPVPLENMVPGDLIFPHNEHVAMYAGGNMMVEASTFGVPVHEREIYFDMTTAQIRRVPGAEYGGSPFAPFDINRAINRANNVTAGTSTTGLNGTTGTGHTEPIARNLFTYQFFPGAQDYGRKIAAMLGNAPGTEEKAFINDEQLIQTVISFSQAGLRNFQSAPNGDFIAYYPDYFGIDGKDAVWHIEDIEMKNVQIDLNDDALATHVYIAGSPTLNASSGGIAGWLNTKGVATVENEWLFTRMAAAAPHVPGERMVSGQQIMEKFGARPLSQSMAAIMSGQMEFMLAVQTFMKKWAEQYATVIETTFMPEIFPGMRVNLPTHKLQVYVAEVTHAGDFENGFTTTMTIMAPSKPGWQTAVSMFTSATAQEIANRQDLFRNAAEVPS